MNDPEVPTQPLAGQEFLFDYGEIAKFRLRFTPAWTVEVTNLVGDRYSVSASDTFFVEVEAVSPGVYRIAWMNTADGTRLTHLADFATDLTIVTIDDKRLREIRQFSGTIIRA